MKKKIFTFEFYGWIILLLIGGFLLFFFTFFITNHTEKSKLAKSKDMYRQVSRYINAEMARCIIDETTAMDGNLTCSGRTADSVIAAAVIATKDVQMNPYELDKSAVTSGGTNTSDSDVGYIRLSVSGEDIIIKTCHTKPCSNEINRISKTIEIK